MPCETTESRAFIFFNNVLAMVFLFVVDLYNFRFVI